MKRSNREDFDLINEPLIDHDGGRAELEFYLIRRTGTQGVSHALRRYLGADGNMACIYLFRTRFDAIKWLDFQGIDDPNWWDIVSSKHFGGALPLLKEAVSIATHITIAPPVDHAGAVFPVWPIEAAIHYFESLPAEESNSGGRKIPFWLLRHEAGGEFGIVPEPGILAICLFKSEMDAEEFRHSCWIPDEAPADEWECVWPANPDGAVALLEEISSKGISHAVINVPPGGAQRPLSTPIEVIIDHVASRGHIEDLDPPQGRSEA
jgi:hypothetical protein